MAKTSTLGARKSARRNSPGRVRHKTWKRKNARSLAKALRARDAKK